MFIVRVNHKNGLYLEFLFLDPGRAEACAKTCAEARLRGNAHPPKDAGCEVQDDAGRQTWLDGSQMASVQFVALEDEVKFNTRMKVIIDMTARQWLQDMGLADHPAVTGPTNGRTAPQPEPVQHDMPAIGTFSA